MPIKIKRQILLRGFLSLKILIFQNPACPRSFPIFRPKYKDEKVWQTGHYFPSEILFFCNFLFRADGQKNALLVRNKKDDLVKSLKMRFFVIPAKAGILYFQKLINTLDSGFHRSDDFLRSHQEGHSRKIYILPEIFHAGIPLSDKSDDAMNKFT